ncbi:hypothetical protein ACLKA7_015031 [Drosophila subpalustris]
MLTLGPNPGPQSITDIDTLSIISNSCNLTDTNITNTTKTKTNAEFIRRKNCSDKKKLEKKQDPFEWTQAHPPCLRRNHSSPP